MAAQRGVGVEQLLHPTPENWTAPEPLIGRPIPREPDTATAQG